MRLCNNYRCKGISDKGIEQLGKALTYLQSLQSIILNFSKSFKIINSRFNNYRCEQITNEGIRQLPKALRQLQSIQNITLLSSGFSHTFN